MVVVGRGLCCWSALRSSYVVDCWFRYGKDVVVVPVCYRCPCSFRGKFAQLPQFQTRIELMDNFRRDEGPQVSHPPERPVQKPHYKYRSCR